MVAVSASSHRRLRSSFPPPGRAEIISSAQSHAFDFPLVGGAFVSGFIEEGSIFVIEILEFDALDFPINKSLDGCHVGPVFSHHESEGITQGLGAAGPANPM